MSVSLAEVLVILVCGGGMFLILAVGAWILVNKRSLEQSDDRRARLDALDREYATGDLDEAEYDRRRSEILSDRMR